MTDATLMTVFVSAGLIMFGLIFYARKLALRVKILEYSELDLRERLSSLQKQVEHSNHPETARDVPSYHNVVETAEIAEAEPQGAVDRFENVEEFVPVERSDKVVSEPKPDFEEEVQAAYSDDVIEGYLHEALHNQNIDVFLQPVVQLPQRRTTHFEVYGRIRAKAGVYIPANQYLDIAQREHMDKNVDRILLIECLKLFETFRDIQDMPPLFINVSFKTLSDRTYMNLLLERLRKSTLIAEKIIFEVPVRDLEHVNPAISNIMSGLVALGCRFSADHIDDLQSVSPERLKNNHVSFVKINQDVFLKSFENMGHFKYLLSLKREYEEAGIEMIAEKIEYEHDLRELLDYGISYGQGFLFGKPALQAAYTAQIAS